MLELSKKNTHSNTAILGKLNIGDIIDSKNLYPDSSMVTILSRSTVGETEFCVHQPIMAQLIYNRSGDNGNVDYQLQISTYLVGSGGITPGHEDSRSYSDSWGVISDRCDVVSDYLALGVGKYRIKVTSISHATIYVKVKEL